MGERKMRSQSGSFPAAGKMGGDQGWVESKRAGGAVLSPGLGKPLVLGCGAGRAGGSQLLCFGGREGKVGVGRARVGSCRGAWGGENSGSPGPGVGFLCVRRQGPRGRHLRAGRTMRKAPPCAEPAAAPPPPQRGASSRAKGAGAEAAGPRSPARGAAPRPPRAP